jgi:TolB protein
MNTTIKQLLTYLTLPILFLSLSGCATTSEKASAQQKTIYEKISSDPPGASIYWGEIENRLTYTGKTTPFTKPNAAKSPVFKTWFYQVKKDGYYDSKVIMMPYTSEDRIINFTLKPKRTPSQAPTATANVNGIVRVTNNSSLEFYPRPSPDGKEILCNVIDPARQGYESYSIVSIKEGEAARKTVVGNYAAYPSWYPDGKNLIYSYYKMGNPVLVKAGVQGVGMKFITPNSPGSHDQRAHISSDGAKIVFSKIVEDTNFICTMNLDGSELTAYVEGSSPRWNKTNSIIVFTRQVDSYSHIFTLDLKTGRATQLTKGDSNNVSPSFSPDGRWVVFSSDRDVISHLYVMKPDGSNLVQLTTGDSQEIDPAWSNDGTIYFSSDAGSSESIEKPVNWSHSNIWRLRPVLN